MHSKFRFGSHCFYALFCSSLMLVAVNGTQAQENASSNVTTSHHSTVDVAEIKKKLAIILAPSHVSADADQEVLQALNKLALPPQQGVPFYASLLKRYNDYDGTHKSDSQPINFNIVTAGYIAFDKLDGYGIKAAPAIGELVRFARDSGNQAQTLKVLNNVVPGNASVVSLFIQSLKNENSEVVHVASLGLASAKSKAHAAIPTLVQLVREGGDKSCYVYYALGEVVRNRYPMSVVEATKCLNEIEKQPLGRGAVALLVMGEAARKDYKALQPLLGFMSRSKRDCQRYATMQTLKINGLVPQPDCVRALLNQVREDSESDIIERTANNILSEKLNINSKAALVPLNLALKQPDRKRRATAALALSKMGATATGALPNLIFAFQHELTTPRESELRPMFEALEAEGGGRKFGYMGLQLSSYVSAFQSLGPLAKPITPTIIKTLNSLEKYWSNNNVRSDLFDILLSVGLPSNPKDRQIILQEAVVALKSNGMDEVTRAAQIVEKIPESASVTTPLLLKFLKLGEQNGILDTPEERAARNKRARTFDSTPETYERLDLTGPYMPDAFAYSIRALAVLGKVDKSGKELLTRYANVAPKPNLPIDWLRLEAQETLKKLN